MLRKGGAGRGIPVKCNDKKTFRLVSNYISYELVKIKASREDIEPAKMAQINKEKKEEFRCKIYSGDAEIFETVVAKDLPNGAELSMTQIYLGA